MREMARFLLEKYPSLTDRLASVVSINGSGYSSFDYPIAPNRLCVGSSLYENL